MKLLKRDVYCDVCEKQLPNKLSCKKTHICFECASDKSIFICKKDAERLLLELKNKQQYYYRTYALYKIVDFEADDLIIFFS